MKQKTEILRTMTTIVVLTAIFFLFFVASGEERSFEEWKEYNLSLFRWFKDIQYYCHTFLQINDRILFDIPFTYAVLEPFQSGLIGRIRKNVYLRLVPSIQNNLSLLRYKKDPYLLGRVGRRKRFKFSNPREIERMIGREPADLSSLGSLMLINNIRYYLCNFKDPEWSKKKEKFENLGFYLVYNNPHYMLFKLQMVEKENKETIINKIKARTE